jgi:HlyD family secretion protein
MKSRFKRIGFWIRLAVTLAILAGGAAGVYRMRYVQAAGTLPVAPARKGDFLVIVRCRGEVRARSSRQIIAPTKVPQLRIVWLAPPGSPVKEGDPVVRFDPSSAREQLREKEAMLKQMQATLEQAIAQARITFEQDKRDLAGAKYDVERARLEASKVEIVSRLQGEESKIDLGLAEQKLRVQQATVDLHATSDKAKTASIERQRDQAQSDVDVTKRRLERMEIKSPGAGVIVYMTNYSQGWVNAKPFKVGDQVWPGATIAEIPDLATLEMEGRVEEIDRGRLNAGSEVKVRIDSLPELTLAAKLDSISLLTVLTMEWPPSSNFRGYAHINNPDPRLRPGMNGSMDVVVNRIPGAISIPAKALFTHQGKPIVYLASKGGYEPREVQVQARNPDEVAISGIPAGAMITLAEPEKKEQAR